MARRDEHADVMRESRQETARSPEQLGLKK
jgi:hypothetical protein